MRKFFKNLLDLEKTVLTEKLAPKLAPFAKIVYVIGLILMTLFFVRLMASLFVGGDFSVFLFDLLMLIAEFALIRMFCEYLASSDNKSKK